jgi:hypothetical protein
MIRQFLAFVFLIAGQGAFSRQRPIDLKLWHKDTQRLDPIAPSDLPRLSHLVSIR